MMENEAVIRFFSDGLNPTLRERRRLKAFLIQLFRKEKVRLSSLTYIFVSDERLFEINQQYLGHDDFTDIITFPMNRPGENIEGEIYISVERVRENAQNFKVSFRQEIHRVIIHGALHLCGFRDKTSTQQAEMRKMEEKYLNQYFG